MWPLRWTRITSSHSSSVILAMVRSRRIPALFTRTSRRPNVSTAISMSRCAPSQSETSSPFATALPPSASISATTCSAGSDERPPPWTSAPKSFTTTCAPWRANSSASDRPIPRAPPVTIDDLALDLACPAHPRCPRMLPVRATCQTASYSEFSSVFAETKGRPTGAGTVHPRAGDARARSWPTSPRASGWTTRRDLASTDRDRGWSALRSMGLFGAPAARRRRAPAASGVEVMIVAEALAARLVPQPYLGTVVLPGELLALAGAPAALQAEVADGTARGCVLLDPDVRGLASPPFDDAVDVGLRGCRVRARRRRRVGHGDAPSDHVARRAARGRPHADRRRGRHRAGRGRRGRSAVRTSIAGTRSRSTVLAADVVGAMRGGLDGVGRVHEGAGPVRRARRFVPGRAAPVRRRAREDRRRVEHRSSTRRGPSTSSHPTEALLAARTAKAYTADVARDVGETVMQVYGGIGQTWEHIAHFFLRRHDALVAGARRRVRAAGAHRRRPPRIGA